MDTQREGPRSPADLYNRAVESFRKGKLADAIAFLRSGFFENLYVTPLLLHEEVEAHQIWHAGAHAGVDAAREYVSRYRGLWDDCPRGLAFVRSVWNDPLVRNEVKSYTSLCKALMQASARQREDLLRERERFASPGRIIRTQAEILRRVSQNDLDMPARRPFLGLVMLSSYDPAASAEFYRKLFGIEPVRTRNVAGGYVEFELEGIHLAIHGYNQHGQGDPYGLGPPPRSLGWGAFFVIRVLEFDRYYQRAVESGIEIIDSDLQETGQRFFVVKDPSGYVFEVTEEELRGLSDA